MQNNVDNDVKKTVKAMIYGSIIYNVVLLIFVLIFSTVSNNNPIEIVKNILSIVIGTLICLIGIKSLLNSVIVSLDLNEEKKAKAHMVLSSIIRIVVFLIVLVLIMLFLGHIPGILMVISVFGIKIGAYMAPKIKEKI